MENLALFKKKKTSVNICGRREHKLHQAHHTSSSYMGTLLADGSV